MLTVGGETGWQCLNFISVPCSFFWSSKCDKGSNIHLKHVCTPPPDPLSPPKWALQAVWLGPGSVHAVWGCCEGQLFPSPPHGTGQSGTANTEQDRARVKKQKGLIQSDIDMLVWMVSWQRTCSSKVSGSWAQQATGRDGVCPRLRMCLYNTAGILLSGDHWVRLS